MDNKNRNKILLWGQVLFLIESILYISVSTIYIIGNKSIFDNYITLTESAIFGVLGIVLLIVIPFLILKYKFIVNIIIALRVIILIYSLIFFNNFTLIFLIELVIFIYSIAYIYAYLTLKKGY